MINLIRRVSRRINPKYRRLYRNCQEFRSFPYADRDYIYGFWRMGRAVKRGISAFLDKKNG